MNRHKEISLAVRKKVAYLSSETGRPSSSTMTEVSSVESKGDTKSSSPNPQPNRFNFYDAEEINKQVSKDGHKEEENPKNPKRFNFYNAAEVNEAAGPIQIPRRTSSQPRSLSLTSVTPNMTRSSSANKNTIHPPTPEVVVDPRMPVVCPKSDTAVVSEDKDIDSNEILRSLQETERQRTRKKSINQRLVPTPRIQNNSEKDTTTHVQRQQTITPEDVVMQSRMDIEGGSESREAERQNRQERMAKYASKIVESKLETFILPPESPETKWTPIPGTLFDAEKLIMQRSQSDDFRDLSPVASEEEVFDAEELIRRRSESEDCDTRAPQDQPSQDPPSQEERRNVEQVMNAILERANAGERKSINHESELDALNKAMEDLQQPCLSFETISTIRTRRPNRRESEEHVVQEAKLKELKMIEEKNHKQLVVDELLEVQVKECSNAQDPIPEAPLTPTDTPMTNDSFCTSPTDEIDGDPDVASDVASLSSIEDGTEEMLADDSDENEIFEDEDVYDTNNVSLEGSTLTNVLGPLSRGNSTGVVLEASDPPPLPPPSPEEALAPLSPASIYETLSSAVREAESFMCMTLGGYPSPAKDKYSTHDDDENGGQVPVYDDEAHELMRSLCAHLLPYGVDKSSKTPKSESIPVWDESNPDEAGYRIIRLTKRQLRRVEREFDLMIKTVKQSSERDLNGKMTQKDHGEDWNGVPDDEFERDLEAAEQLLDQEEKRQEEANHNEDVESEDESESGSDTHSSGSETGSSRSGSRTNDRSQSAIASDDDETFLTSHPEFPGVKTPGRGEIGDLEFFHLPIIYKSNVTGFEPTKDLFLEPGNVVAGQYLVESELGSAAFSTAYRCVDLSTETINEQGVLGHDDVCLKVIKNTKDFFDQSLDEIKILELLRQTGKCHEKHILEMKTFFYHREHLIIVTELLRQNLFEFGKFITDSAEEPYFTLPRLCWITRQVLIALDFVHRMGLVHSDVKPENILLSSYSRAQVKLIDFGSSCYLTDRQSSYIQSRSYRAPEVVLGLPYGSKIDMWSLGCVVAEMYTGEVTFQNDSIVSMLSRIEAICGPFPRHMIAQGRQSGRFFTKSGLLFENVENDRSDGRPSSKSQFDVVEDDALLDVFQPKRTTMAARLGIPEITNEDEAQFVDFCSKLLIVDPDSRPTAKEALKHPWIVGGTSLTELDIKYPSI